MGFSILNCILYMEAAGYAITDKPSENDNELFKKDLSAFLNY